MEHQPSRGDPTLIGLPARSLAGHIRSYLLLGSRFFEAQNPRRERTPTRPADGLDPPIGQLGRQATQREGRGRDPLAQPLGAIPRQGPRLAAADLRWSQRAGLPLAPGSRFHGVRDRSASPPTAEVGTRSQYRRSGPFTVVCIAATESTQGDDSPRSTGYAISGLGGAQIVLHYQTVDSCNAAKKQVAGEFNPLLELFRASRGECLVLMFDPLVSIKIRTQRMDRTSPGAHRQFHALIETQIIRARL